jgi:hypothetical protein
VAISATSAVPQGTSASTLTSISLTGFSQISRTEKKQAVKSYPAGFLHTVSRILHTANFSLDLNNNMLVRSTLSSFLMASQIKVTEQKQLIDELRKELELARATLSAGHPPIWDWMEVCSTHGASKRHSSQQLVVTAKEPRSFANIATGTLPKQGTSAQAQAPDRAHFSSQPQPHAGKGIPWSKNHRLVKGICCVQNKGAIREEVEKPKW